MLLYTLHIICRLYLPFCFHDCTESLLDYGFVIMDYGFSIMDYEFLIMDNKFVIVDYGFVTTD